MKNLTIALLLSICGTITLAIPANNAVSFTVQAPSLARDLEELLTIIPSKPLMKLIVRYLLNDAEFQAVTRTLNSQDAYMVRMRFRSQPEVIAFNSWTRSQLMLAGGSFESLESAEIDLFKSTPYWANSVYGWQGFVNEFLTYYSPNLVRSQIDAKVAQNGIFAEFWARLKGLKPAYERVLAFPETQRLLVQLQSQRVDVNQLDQLIRTQFDWQNVAAPVPDPVIFG